MPRFAGRLSGCALNVPVQRGSFPLRLNLRHESVRVSDWHYTGFDQGLIVGNRVYLDAGPANYRINVIGVAEDPIVSCDVIGCRQTLLFDAKGTQRAGSRMVKTLAWYETLGHACRVLDVVRTYAALA